VKIISAVDDVVHRGKSSYSMTELRGVTCHPTRANTPRRAGKAGTRFDNHAVLTCYWDVTVSKITHMSPTKLYLNDQKICCRYSKRYDIIRYETLTWTEKLTLWLA